MFKHITSFLKTISSASPSVPAISQQNCWSPSGNHPLAISASSFVDLGTHKSTRRTLKKHTHNNTKLMRTIQSTVKFREIVLWSNFSHRLNRTFKRVFSPKF